MLEFLSLDGPGAADAAAGGGQLSTASQEAPKLKVFVSYSREDLELKGHWAEREREHGRRAYKPDELRSAGNGGNSRNPSTKLKMSAHTGMHAQLRCRNRLGNCSFWASA